MTALAGCASAGALVWAGLLFLLADASPSDPALWVPLASASIPVVLFLLQWAKEWQRGRRRGRGKGRGEKGE